MPCRRHYRLRSLTEGRATFSMLFHAYDTLQAS